MFRRMRRRMRTVRPPIVSFKHQRSENLTYAGLDANNNFTIYDTISQGMPTTPQNVPGGAKVFSIDVSVNFVSDTASSTGVFSWMIIKLRDGQGVADVAATNASNWSNVGLSNMRNQIFETNMGVFPTEDGGVIRYNKHIKIPKIYHRCREGDTMVLVWNSDNAGTLSIGTRYKSYT